MQCRKGILSLSWQQQSCESSAGICKGGSPHLSSITYRQADSFPHPVCQEKGLLLCQKTGDWYSAAARAARREKVFLLHPAARFSVLSVLGDAVLWSCLAPWLEACLTCVSKPEEFLYWTEEEMLDRVLSLGREGAHYNADKHSSCTCKEQGNCSFLYLLLLVSLAGTSDLSLGGFLC